MTEWVNTSFRYANDTRQLHPDPGCPHLDEHSTPIEDARIDREALDLCDYCTRSIARTQKADTDCPFCGESVPQLPGHLPCEGVE